MITARVPWTQLLLLAWVVLFAWSAVQRLAPASEWFAVESITVKDARLGEDPAIFVNREIKQTFTGIWTIDVEREVSAGQFENVCAANGQAVYRPDNVLSRPVAFSRWVADYCLPEEPGRYRLDVDWIIMLPGGLTKSVQANSNTFRITD